MSTKQELSKQEEFSVRSIVEDLRSMMTTVTKQECTPNTVNAACNAADKITNLLKLQLEYERMVRSRER